MKVVVISDTHGLHNNLVIPQGEMLIHCGDFTLNGSESEVQDFMKWLMEQPYKYKVLIAGNHDYFLEKYPECINEKGANNLFFLKDSGVEINGIKFWGSPYTPEYKNMAFNLQRGEILRKHWQKIPNDVNVLITHGPPQGILDQNIDGENVGCEALFNRVTKIKPTYHLFGHVHEAAGEKAVGGTVFINASNTNKGKELAKPFPCILKI